MSRLFGSGFSGLRTAPIARGVGIAAMILVFVAILFPWQSVARRVAHEIGVASGARIEFGRLAPALSARGPVLAASEVVVDHPALERLRIRRLELAPRLSRSWLSGEPTLRVWADSQLAQVDGVLRLGSSPTFHGRVERVQIEGLPLRLDASGLALSGLLAADADVTLDPTGALRGSVDFDSDTLVVQTPLLPLAIPFTRVTGTVAILENGATRIRDVSFEGPLLKGLLGGEIGLVHRSLSPPIDLEATLQVLDPTLRQMAPSAGLMLSASGEAEIHVGGTIDAPEITPKTAALGRARTAAGRP